MMKAAQLIALLQQLPPDTNVYVWHDGEEHEIYETDTVDYCEEINAAQINTHNSDQYANS